MITESGLPRDGGLNFYFCLMHYKGLYAFKTDFFPRLTGMDGPAGRAFEPAEPNRAGIFFPYPISYRKHLTLTDIDFR